MKKTALAALAAMLLSVLALFGSTSVASAAKSCGGVDKPPCHSVPPPKPKDDLPKKGKAGVKKTFKTKVPKVNGNDINGVFSITVQKVGGGTVQKTTKRGTDGHAYFTIKGLPKGTYIVTIKFFPNNKVYKSSTSTSRYVVR